MKWEYRKIDLNQLPRRGNRQVGDDLDLLNDVGRDGWELVHISVHKIAYLKRGTQPPKTGTRAAPKK